MKKIYQNFDKFAVAFQGAFPQHILQQLETAKMEAQERKEPALAYLGTDQIQVHVEQTGSKGGFTYLFDTGLDAQKWAVSKSQDTTGWNIYVTVSSMGLALHGYEEVKKQIYELLESFDVKPPSLKNPDTGSLYEKPVESISRVDFCIDFRTKSFQPSADNFVAYRVKKKSLHGQFSEHTNGKHIETITVGKLPNRQVTLYNKTREVKSKPVEKSYWWKIWGINPDSFEDQIWRVEVRAGKTELKDRWDITSFDDLEEKIGNVIAYTLQNYRYTEPNIADSNKSRWPNAPFWGEAIQAAESALSGYTNEHASREQVLRGTWHEKHSLYMNNLTGNSISLAALLGIDINELPSVLDKIKSSLQKSLEREEEAHVIHEKLEKAKERFAFLVPYSAKDTAS